MKWSLERKGKANSSPMAQNDTREDSCLDRHPEHSEGSVFSRTAHESDCKVNKKI
jgi:hypothetical protein